MPSPREKIMWRKALQKAIADGDDAAEKKYRALLADEKPDSDKPQAKKSMAKKKSMIT